MPQQQMPQQVAQQQAPQQQMPQQMPVASNPFQSPSVAPSELPPLPPVQADVDRYTQTYFGVSPAQIRRLREVVNDRQRTVATPAKAPRPVTGTISVSLAPGTTPPVIRTYMGNSTSFVVVDSSGAPWPVENYRIGNSAAFQIYRLDAGQGSSFALDTAVPYGQSNLILKLSGVATPVVIDLMAGQSELDARVEVRVQGRGPNSITQSVSLPQGTDSRLLPVLNGIAPEGGKMLSVTGLDGVRAWMMPSGRMVVRTPVKIVSPASPSFVSSADGTHVYEFMPTTQLLGLVDGQFVALQVEGW
jgi:intracellular multiplication protein IcmK